MDGWIAPWRPGLAQARCRGTHCTPKGQPPLVVVAMTLRDGLCAQCASRPEPAEEPVTQPVLFELDAA